jgi:hypothetical protein
MVDAGSVRRGFGSDSPPTEVPTAGGVGRAVDPGRGCSGHRNFVPTSP